MDPEIGEKLFIHTNDPEWAKIGEKSQTSHQKTKKNFERSSHSDPQQRDKL